MLLGENHRHTGMDLRNELVRLARDHRASAQPFSGLREGSCDKPVKQKRKARTGFNPKTQQKIRIPAKTVLKFPVAKVAKDTVLGVKK
jgi:hypothetical protein